MKKSIYIFVLIGLSIIFAPGAFAMNAKTSSLASQNLELNPEEGASAKTYRIIIDNETVFKGSTFMAELLFTRLSALGYEPADEDAFSVDVVFIITWDDTMYYTTFLHFEEIVAAVERSNTRKTVVLSLWNSKEIPPDDSFSNLKKVLAYLPERKTSFLHFALFAESRLVRDLAITAIERVQYDAPQFYKNFEVITPDAVFSKIGNVFVRRS